VCDAHLCRWYLHDKVVLVTEVVRVLAWHCPSHAGYGAHLVLASRHVDHLRAVAHEAQAQGVQAFPVRTDVRDPAQVQALIQWLWIPLGVSTCS